MNWQWILVVFIVLVLLALVLLAKPVQVGLRTAGLLLDLGVSYKWKTGAIPRGILISEITYPCGSRTITANLYRPDDRRQHSGLILGHGAFEGGKDDWRMKLIGESLARAGYVALIPHLEHLARLRLDQEDVDALVSSFHYLSRQEFTNAKLGMVGFCLSAPLVLLAAEEPSISQDIAVVSSWGGYYDIKDWLQAVITGYSAYRGETKPWQPSTDLLEELPKWLIELLPSPSDRVCIEEMLKGNSLSSAKDNLSSSGEAMYELLSNGNSEQFEALWARLDVQTRQTLASLSPSTRIDQLQTKVAIIHGFADPIVPSVESYKLADAVKDENEVYFRIFYQFAHVDPNKLFEVRLSNLRNIISEATGFYFYLYHTLYQL